MHRTIDMTLSLLFLLRHLHASSYPAIYPTSEYPALVLPVCLRVGVGCGGWQATGVSQTQPEPSAKVPTTQSSRTRARPLSLSLSLPLACPPDRVRRPRPTGGVPTSLPTPVPWPRSLVPSVLLLLTTYSDKCPLSLSSLRPAEPRSRGRPRPRPRSRDW